MEIIWRITLPFPQEYPEEPQRFHNLKPCVIMSYAFAYTNIFCAIKRGGRAGAVANVMLWSDPWPDVSSPGLHPAALRHSPSLQTGETTMFFSNLPQQSPPCLSSQPLLRVTVFTTGRSSPAWKWLCGMALWHGSVTWLCGLSQGTWRGLQTLLEVLPSDSPRLWLCSSACTGPLPGVMRDDPEQIFNHIQAHPLLNDNCLTLLSSLPSHPSPWFQSSLKGWAFSLRWLPECKEIHIGRGVRLDQAKFHCVLISAQIILLKRRKQSCSRWERLFIASHGYLARFTEGLSSCTQGIMLSSNLRKHPWDFQPPLEIEIQQETTNTPRN